MGNGNKFTNGSQARLAPRRRFLKVKNTAKAYDIEVALPGIGPDDVKVELKDHALTIMAEHEERAEVNRNGRACEKSEVDFYLASMPLPSYARTEAVRTSFKEGVLRIHVPFA